MTAQINPAAPHHLPPFITAPGETDVLMMVMAVVLVLAVLGVGVLFLRLHTLPERIAHRSHKLQFEIVAVLGLLALFTHIHLFWVAGLLLALIDFPDFGGLLSRIARSLEKMAGIKPTQADLEAMGETIGHARRDEPELAVSEEPVLVSRDGESEAATIPELKTGSTRS
jgi:hypothetical protein